MELLQNINQRVKEQDHYDELLDEAIDLFGFDRSKVVMTEGELDQVIDRSRVRGLLEDFGSSFSNRPSMPGNAWNRGVKGINPDRIGRPSAGAMWRAEDRGWVQNAVRAGRRQQDQEQQPNQQRRLGIQQNQPQQQVAPEVGHRIFLPNGVGQIVDLDLAHGQVMIQDPRGKEFVIKTSEMMPQPRKIRDYTVWMLNK